MDLDDIRKFVFEKNISISAVARELDYSENYVRLVLDGNQTPGKHLLRNIINYFSDMNEEKLKKIRRKKNRRSYEMFRKHLCQKCLKEIEETSNNGVFVSDIPQD